MKFVLISTVLIFFILVISCDNPFAPRLSGNITQETVLGDQTTIDGLFKNFRYAYTYKDTLVYGNLLTDDFAFVYKNYDKGSQDFTWARIDDLIATNGLFQAAQSIDLVWNGIVSNFGDSLTKVIRRSFTLNITFSPSDIVTVEGAANLTIVRKKISDPWKIYIWRDESS